MKKVQFDNLPGGSIVLVKDYTRWERFKAWIKGKELTYNEVYIDPFGGSSFLFKNGIDKKYNVFTFVPRKSYSKKEMNKLFTEVMRIDHTADDAQINMLLVINHVRPFTFVCGTLEEMLDNNKYYIKTEIK